MELEPLKRALARSEERNKQLVEITQQWEIECQEKDSHIAILETQNQQFRQERELFKKKLAKYKKQASVDREQKVSDSQFEELRDELGYRRELYDKVCTVTPDDIVAGNSEKLGWHGLHSAMCKASGLFVAVILHDSLEC